jgi:CubicO group peptidase (beta-lactamase class C family)
MMGEKYHHLISYMENIKEANISSASALMIIKDDKVVLEHYSGGHSNSPNSLPVGESSQFNVASSRKSYLGLVIAYALYEGKIKSLDEYARDYFDEYDRELLGDTTLRHLVTHSHGLRENKDGRIFREFKEGEGWAYRRINTTMTVQLVNSLYKKPFPQLLEERVFQPLELKETGWRTEEDEKLVKVMGDPDEPPKSRLGSKKDGTEFNFFVSTREFARWGQLHLNKGYLNGRQVVPREVIEQSTQIQSPVYNDKDLPLNGLFWYVQGAPALKSEIGERVPKGSYQILGFTGPRILVIPEYNVVVAKMYNKEKNYGGKDYLHYVREFGNLVADTFK